MDKISTLFNITQQNIDIFVNLLTSHADHPLVALYANLVLLVNGKINPESLSTSDWRKITFLNQSLHNLVYNNYSVTSQEIEEFKKKCEIEYKTSSQDEDHREEFNLDDIDLATLFNINE